MLVDEILSALLGELNTLDSNKAMQYHNELGSMGFTCDFGGALVTSEDEWPENLTSDDLTEIVDEISRYIEDHHIPPYCYLGNHEGDGACFGCWPDIDCVNMAIDDKEIIKVNDLNEIPSEYNGDYAFVNCHGNMTCGHAINGETTKTYWDCV